MYKCAPPAHTHTQTHARLSAHPFDHLPIRPPIHPTPVGPSTFPPIIGSPYPPTNLLQTTTPSSGPQRRKLEGLQVSNRPFFCHLPTPPSPLLQSPAQHPDITALLQTLTTSPHPIATRLRLSSRMQHRCTTSTRRSPRPRDVVTLRSDQSRRCVPRIAGARA